MSQNDIAEVDILKIETGEVRTYTVAGRGYNEPYDWYRYWLDGGNGDCDCGREDAWMAAHEGPDWEGGVECGNGRFETVALRWNGQVIFGEAPHGRA